MKKRVLNGKAVEYTREVYELRRLSAAIISYYLPGTIRAIGAQAAKGNGKAARLLFSFLEFINNSRPRL